MLMGFAMIFSTNSHAKLIFCVDITKNISKVDKPVTVIRKYSLTKKIECKQIANNYSFEIDKKSPVYKNIKKEFKKRSNGSRPRNKNYTLDEFKALVGSQSFYLFTNNDDVLITTTAQASVDKKSLDLLKQQVEWRVWVKHVDKDYKNQKPYVGKSDYIIYDIKKEKYFINPNNPKEEAIFFAKAKCQRDNPKNPDGCLIDKINESSINTRKTNSYDRPTET